VEIRIQAPTYSCSVFLSSCEGTDGPVAAMGGWTASYAGGRGRNDGRVPGRRTHKPPAVSGGATRRPRRNLGGALTYERRWHGSTEPEVDVEPL
jgi:hypothetical protein